MGTLLSLLKSPEQEPIDIPIDFNSPPNANEKLHAEIDAVTQRFSSIIALIKDYSGCGEQIRQVAQFLTQAISSPSKENDQIAWAAILPAVSLLKDLYEFNQKLEQLLPRLLNFLCAGNTYESIEKNQASAYQLALIIDFALHFDILKMSNPNIQNDFSYYRRTVSRMKMSNDQGEIVVSDELANRMSLFFAHSNPVTKSLIDAVQNGVSMRQLPLDRVIECFGVLAGVSYCTVKRGKTQPQGDLLYLRVMVASILFYDHLDKEGAFTKESMINVCIFNKLKSSVGVIKSNGASETEMLMNVLKFSTIHLNAESTPKDTKKLFQ